MKYIRMNFFFFLVKKFEDNLRNCRFGKVIRFIVLWDFALELNFYI